MILMTWRTRRLTLEELRVWLIVWVPDPSVVIRPLFSMRLWSVPETAVVLLTPTKDNNDVWAGLHIL